MILFFISLGTCSHRLPIFNFFAASLALGLGQLGPPLLALSLALSFQRKPALVLRRAGLYLQFNTFSITLKFLLWDVNVTVQHHCDQKHATE